VAISTGAGLGFLSGLTGTGGGIFLTPLLLFCRWAHIRQAAAVSALFFWVNSIGGLVGHFTKVQSIPSLGLILAPAAIVGGIVGSHLGSRRFAVRVISFLLATVLLIAGMKLLFLDDLAALVAASLPQDGSPVISSTSAPRRG
jgi:hypothetical protein